MLLTPLQTIIMTLSIAAGTMLTRFLPFLVFPENKESPKIITSIGKMLPPAMMGLLVVYCLKDISLSSGSHGLPELISIAVIVAVHKLKKNVLLSIAVGTIVYMILIQLIFV